MKYWAKKATYSSTFLIVSFLVFMLNACQKFDTRSINPDYLFTSISTDIFDVEFISDSIGFACGGERSERGLIFKTTDGGFTWTDTTLIDPLCNYSIEFINEDTGYVGGEFNRLFFTYDGGKNWNTWWFQPQELATHEIHRPSVRDIQYLGNGKIRFVGGESYEVGSIYQSDDYGQTWSFDTLDHELRSLSYFNYDNGFVSGYGYIGNTENGSDFQRNELDGDFFTAIQMLSESMIITCGNNGGIYKSSNGGNSWKEVKAPNKALGKRHAFHDMAFYDSEIGFAVGQYGLILKTEDAGESWEILDASEDSHLNQIHFYKDQIYIAANDGKVLSFSVFD